MLRKFEVWSEEAKVTAAKKIYNLFQMRRDFFFFFITTSPDGFECIFQVSPQFTDIFNNIHTMKKSSLQLPNNNIKYIRDNVFCCVFIILFFSSFFSFISYYTRLRPTGQPQIKYCANFCVVSPLFTKAHWSCVKSIPLWLYDTDSGNINHKPQKINRLRRTKYWKKKLMFGIEIRLMYVVFYIGSYKKCLK